MSKINALNFAVKIVHMHTWTLHLLLFIITQISIAIFIDFKPSKVMVVFFSFFQSLYFFNLLKGRLFFFFLSLLLPHSLLWILLHFVDYLDSWVIQNFIFYDDDNLEFLSQSEFGFNSYNMMEKFCQFPTCLEFILEPNIHEICITYH